MPSIDTVVVGGDPDIVAKFEDHDSIMDLTVMLDLPEICSVARYIFDTGCVGYECIFTTQADVEDYAVSQIICERAVRIHMDAWYPSPGGFRQFRALWVEPPPEGCTFPRRVATEEFF